LSGNRRRSFLFSVLSLCLLFCSPASGSSDRSTPGWSTKLDGKISFYQSTELGVLVTATQNSLYAIDGESGEILWRRKNVRLDATDIAPMMGTDLVLLNLEKDKRAPARSRRSTLWQTDLAERQAQRQRDASGCGSAERTGRPLCLVRDAKDKPRGGFKRRPTVHLLSLASRR
jgi:hypothetical protein